MREELQKAIAIEEEFLDKYGKVYYMAFFNKIKDLGYSSVEEYQDEKRAALLAAWHPSIYALDANDVAENVSNAIKNEKEEVNICCIY